VSPRRKFGAWLTILSALPLLLLCPLIFSDAAIVFFVILIGSPLLMFLGNALTLSCDVCGRLYGQANFLWREKEERVLIEDRAKTIISYIRCPSCNTAYEVSKKTEVFQGCPKCHHNSITRLRSSEVGTYTYTKYVSLPSFPAYDKDGNETTVNLPDAEVEEVGHIIETEFQCDFCKHKWKQQQSA